MKIIISENQLNNISLNKNWILERVKTNPKKILVTESQYTKLLFKESTRKKSSWVANNPNVTGGESSGWSTLNGSKSNKNSYGDFRVGGDLVHIKYLCGWYNNECEHCQPTTNWGWQPGDTNGSFTGKGTYPSKEMEKFVKLLWKLGKRKANNDTIKRTKGKHSLNTKFNADLIYREGINEYQRLVGEGQIERRKNLKGSDFDGDSVELWSPDDWNNSLQGLRKLGYQLNPSGPYRGAFPRMCSEGEYTTDWGPIGEFLGWVSTWDAQDWIDAAALVAFAIGTVFPPAALVGVGLELVNVGISSYKLAKGEGSWGDVGLRTLFLFGGPLIGRSIGYGLKLGYKAASKLFKIAIDAIKWVGKKTGLIATKEMGEYIVKQNLSKAEREVVEQWIEQIQKNPKGFQDDMAKMEDLIQKAAKGDEAAIKQLKVLREKAISEGLPSSNSLNPFSKVKDKVVKGFNGKTYKVNAYWEEFLNPLGKGLGAKVGATIMTTLYITLKGYEYSNWLDQQNIPPQQQEEIVEFVMGMDNIEEKIDRLYEKTGMSKKDPLPDVILEYSTKVSPEKFDKEIGELQTELTKAFDEVQALYRSGVSEVKGRTKKKDALFNLYNSFCEKVPGYENTLDTVTITSDRPQHQIKQLNTVVNQQGVPFKKYKFVFNHKFRGVYEKSNGLWKNIISDCNKSTQILKDFCDSGNSRALVFCNNLNITNHKLKTFNDVFIDHLESNKNLKVDKFISELEKNRPAGW